MPIRSGCGSAIIIIGGNAGGRHGPRPRLFSVLQRNAPLTPVSVRVCLCCFAACETKMVALPSRRTVARRLPLSEGPEQTASEKKLPLGADGKSCRKPIYQNGRGPDAYPFTKKHPVARTGPGTAGH